jgi:hypothetical protein
LNASCSAGVAAFGLRGRGFSIDQPIARNASKPRCGASDASPSWAAIQRATLPLRAGHKAMYACYRDDRPPVIILDAPHSLYVCPIDLRDDGFEAFDFLDNSFVAGAALRSGDVGMIYLFDGGAHRRFCGGDRFAYLDGQKLHPLQFSELVARIFYDQTVLDPAACQVTYLWNRDANAVIAQSSGRRDVNPYLQEAHNPARLARLLGFCI